MHSSPRLLFSLSLAVVTLAASRPSPADDLDLTLRHRVETAEGSGRYHAITRPESWKPEQTALIVCDMWDLHHCLNAVRREGEFAPRLEQVLQTARKAGVTIIHAPSSCMDHYAGHAARERAMTAPQADNLPEEIGQWCHKIPAEERGVYPVDQSDGGEDDDPKEHAEWEAKLTAMGRNPGTPWKSQIDVLTIDAERDYITDQGDETWNILEARGIKNVILAGVHTNMCVLGRPFGLRQMARNGKNVVLMRDLTDTMYNPKSWPFVSHFTGTDLIVEHIEKFVCPTITSDQLIGGESFVFKNDTRPHVVFLIGEREYRTNETLPKFAADQLGKEYKVSIVHASVEDGNDFPGIEVVKEADVLFVSVRRRTLPKKQLDLVRQHVKAGKPMVGIRTASHAFTLRNKPAPDGLDAWPEFDNEVWGGNYSNHHGNKLVATVNVIKKHADHPILAGVPTESFTSGGSLYVVSPLIKGATPLLRGRVEGHDPEPMAWAFTRADGGRSFYTSLGYIDDFQTPAFVTMLKNAVDWAAGRKVTSQRVSQQDVQRGWAPVTVPVGFGVQDGGARPTDGSPAASPHSAVQELPSPVWYRCYLTIPAERVTSSCHFGVEFPGYPSFPGSTRGYAVWMNGRPLGQCGDYFGSPHELEDTDLKALVIRLDTTHAHNAFLQAGVTAIVFDTEAPPPDGKVYTEWRTPLHGTWQRRVEDRTDLSTLNLPAQYAASPDAIFDLK